MKATKRAKPGSRASQREGAQPKSEPPIPLACPECQGPVWEFRDNTLVRYECLVGHRYTLRTLLEAQADEVETALWAALRAVEERANLQSRLERDARTAGRARSGRLFHARSVETQKHVQVLRRLLEELTR